VVSEAAAECRRIVDHPGLLANSPIVALAYVQVGGAYVFEGETAVRRALKTSPRSLGSAPAFLSLMQQPTIQTEHADVRSISLPRHHRFASS
jgi:hypothetical protein